MTAKHTPGPWAFDAPCIKGCREDMYPILIDLEGSNVSDADARLIAAAPELLACLLDVLDADGDLYAMDFDRYRAAITAATGEGE